jgi:restriction endonuclease Mrr
MTIPDYQIVMLPVLQFATRGETSVREFIADLADELGLKRGGTTRAVAERQACGLREPGPWATIDP